MTLLGLWKMCRRARRHGKYAPPNSIPLNSCTDYGYIVPHDGVWYIVIDGTDTVREWLRNALWFRRGAHKIAHGFLSTAEDMLMQVEQHIIAGSPVILTGHSRGGAVAVALAVIMANKWHLIDHVYTFGSPKLGGRKLRKTMQELGIKHTRVEACGDPVAKLPWIRGRHHQTTHVTLRNDIRNPITKHLSYGELLRGNNT